MGTPELWVAIGFVLFIALLMFLGVHTKIAGLLDNRADRIGQELDEARRLREEAHKLLAEYQRKRKEAEKDAADIVEHAKREASQLVAEAKQKTEDYVARRAALAEQKIGQAERDAVNEVRSKAVDIAIEAARTVLAGKVDAKVGGELFKSSLNELKTRLN